jgi:hypothetical protein
MLCCCRRNVVEQHIATVAAEKGTAPDTESSGSVILFERPLIFVGLPGNTTKCWWQVFLSYLFRPIPTN